MFAISIWYLRLQKYIAARGGGGQGKWYLTLKNMQIQVKWVGDNRQKQGGQNISYS